MRAIANLLYGRANPSGKLAESWPLHYEDVPSAGKFYGKTALTRYPEGRNLTSAYRYL